MPFGTIARWISGDDPNKESRAAEREQQKSLNTQTSLSNQYNLNLYKTEKKNYEQEREYAYDTAITNWEYGKKIKDYQYAKSLAAYGKSRDIYEGQLDYNKQAEATAVSDQEAYIQDLTLSQAFQREAMHSDLESQIKLQTTDLESQIKLQTTDLESQIKLQRSDLKNQIKLQTTDLANQIQLQRSNLLNTIKTEGFNVMSEIKSAGINKLEQGAKLYGIKSGRRIGTESVQQALNEITKKNTFEKEAKFIESLQKSGKAALGQAGVSREKSLQSTAASAFRDLVVLDSSLSGSRNKAAVDLLKLQVDASIAETQVGLNLDRIRLGVTTAQDRSKLNINAAQDRSKLNINAAQERSKLNITTAQERSKLNINAAQEQAQLRINAAQEQTQLRINAAKDEVKYNNKILEANLQSATSQMGRNINQIAVQKQGADLQAKENLNLFPEEFDYAPEPQLPTMRRFVEPPEFVAPTVPKGPRVSTGFDSVLEVVGQAASFIPTGINAYNSIQDIFQ